MVTKTYAFSSSEVTAIVGITPIYLNALVQRELYGISPSISGRGDIKVRIFSEEDVFGIALVWLLFESGLRTESIREVLYELVDTEEPDATAAAEFLWRNDIDYIGIIREPRKPKKKAKPKLRVEPTQTQFLNGLIDECVAKYPTANILLVPVAEKFHDVKRKMDAKYGE